MSYLKLFILALSTSALIVSIRVAYQHFEKLDNFCEKHQSTYIQTSKSARCYHCGTFLSKTNYTYIKKDFTTSLVVVNADTLYFCQIPHLLIYVHTNKRTANKNIYFQDSYTLTPNVFYSLNQVKFYEVRQKNIFEGQRTFRIDATICYIWLYEKDMNATARTWKEITKESYIQYIINS